MKLLISRDERRILGGRIRHSLVTATLMIKASVYFLQGKLFIFL